MIQTNPLTRLARSTSEPSFCSALSLSLALRRYFFSVYTTGEGPEIPTSALIVALGKVSGV